MSIEIEKLLGESYRSQLKTPEWAAYAKRIRYERNSGCELCRMGNVPLHVHHLYYDGKRKPWEYAGDEVIVLCESCHKGLHEQLQAFRKYVFKHCTPRVLQIINGALAVGLTQHDPLVFAHALAELAASPSSVQRYADAWSK